MRLQVLPCLVLAVACCSLGVPRITQAQAFSSSNAAAPVAEVPAAVPATAAAYHGQAQDKDADDSHPRAFHSVAFEAKIGTGGIGFDVATPLNRFLNLRGGAQFFDYTATIDADGILASGDITLQNVHVSVDIFPFRHSSFHVSPGVTIHNDNHIAGPINIPGGQSFSLGDADYTSDPTNPILGFARLRFGSTVAPRFTVGFGNMVPHNKSRISVPIEIGVQYTSAPTLSLYLQGNACSASGCGDINAMDGPENLQSEVQMLESDISPLRFFPIASIGVSYKFGR